MMSFRLEVRTMERVGKTRAIRNHMFGFTLQKHCSFPFMMNCLFFVIKIQSQTFRGLTVRGQMIYLKYRELNYLRLKKRKYKERILISSAL